MNIIKLNFVTYAINSITGTVAESNKSSKTHVYGSGALNAPYSSINISSTTVVNDDIFLIDEQGKEHLFRFANFNVACRPGNTLTVVSTQQMGKKKGRNLVVINHNAEKMFYHEYNVKRLCAPNKYLLGTVFLVIGFILFHYSFNGSNMGKIGFLAIALIAYYIIMEKLNERKLKAAIASMDFKNTKSGIKL